MTVLPSGTATFFFTDIEGSTQLWEKYPDQMRLALAQHDNVLRDAITLNHGHVIKTTGDGIHAVFEKAIDAVNSALEAQRVLQSSDSQILVGDVGIRIRMGLHTGEAELREGDYYGQSLNRAARIMSAGHGGQILLSSITAELAREHLSSDISLLDLGEHRLKDLIRPERIIQLHSPELIHEFPALKSLTALPNNLPHQLTSFIGREREMQEASRLLESARLITLIGPGGTGKTRLSLQLAAEQLHRFKDGVWLVELAPLSDPAFIVSTIASDFDLREAPGVALIDILLDYLRAKELLLILDNCEHLVEASAQITNEVLLACPNVKIVASSREALGINGESVYRVPSLLDNEAVGLFVERATRADSRFQLTEHNASFVAQICSRLDGIPLAIELAAARVKLFTPEQIAARLDDRFKLLTGGSRTALPRQQTLRALIDWSYQSLNETEQGALRRLAVFSGGWTIEAAEAVIGEEEALDGLLGLVNKSLVTVEEQEHKSRYRFLETIRQYAMEKLLESGEAVDVRDRQLDYILQIAAQSENQMFGTETLEWFDQMETEHDNLRAAFEWAASSHPDKALKLAYSAAGFWTVRDHTLEARTRCQAILDKTESMPGLGKERARVYSVLAWMSVTSGEHKAAWAAAKQAISLGRQTNDLVVMTRAHGILALASSFLGDFSTALQALSEGEALARQQDSQGELAFILSIRSQVYYYSGQDPTQAKSNLNEAFQIAKAQGFRWVSSYLAIGMAHSAAMLGDIEAAREGFKESAEIASRMGNKRVTYMSQSEFAHVLRARGILDEPLGIYRDLVPKWRDLGHRSAVAHELECIAYILWRKEEPERAARLLGAAEALRTRIDAVMTGVETTEYEKEIVALRELIGEEEFQKQWTLGGSLSMDEAIQLAIESADLQENLDGPSS